MSHDQVTRVATEEREVWGLRWPDGRILTQGMSGRPLSSRMDVLSDWITIPEGAEPVLLERHNIIRFDPAGQRTVLTVEDVERRVSAIREQARSGDFERLHNAEDELWNDVLMAIAHGASGRRPVDLARAALRTREIDFPRVTA